MSESIEEKIERVLEQVRPALHLDGGDIELVEFKPDSGQVFVKMKGACVGCPMSHFTLKMGVEAALQDAVPEVKEVIAVD